MSNANPLPCHQSCQGLTKTGRGATPFYAPVRVFHLGRRNNHKVRSHKTHGVSIECRIFKNVKEKRNKYTLRENCKWQVIKVCRIGLGEYSS